MNLDVKKAVIQAGGKGTRLYPVTLEMPKPLLTVRRKPILNYLIEFLVKYGITEPIVVIHKDHAEDYEWWQKRYAKALPKKLRIFIEPEPLGTFGGLRFLRDELKEPFIFTNGDELKSFDLKELIASHRENLAKPHATIALLKVPNPSDYGVAVLEGEKGSSLRGTPKQSYLLIKKFIEKPKNPPSNYINSGLALLEPAIFDYADFQKGFLMIERDIYPKVATAEKLAGYKIRNGKWLDCGTFSRWEKAIKEW